MPNIYNHVEDTSLLNDRHERDLYVTPQALIRHVCETMALHCYGVERTLNMAYKHVNPDFGAIMLFHPYFFLWTQGRYERLFSTWSWRVPAVTYVIPWRVPLVEGETSGLPSEFSVSLWLVGTEKEKWISQPYINFRFLRPFNVKNVWSWDDEETT